MNPILYQPPRESAAGWLAAQVSCSTVEWHPHAALVTRALALSAPSVGTVHVVLEGFGVNGSSILSRYQRAKLPTPKVQLVLFRLMLAVTMQARGAVSIVDIAYALDYSSPQSFGRHVRLETGRSARAFLAQWEPEPFWRDVVAPVLRWDDERWTTFDPLEGRRRNPVRVQTILWGSAA